MFENITLRIRLSEYGEKEIVLKKIPVSDGWEFTNENESDFLNVRISVFKKNNTYILKSELELIPHPYDYMREFDSDCGAVIGISFKDKSFMAVGSKKYNPFWTEPKFFESGKNNNETAIQQLLINADEKYIHIMPLADENAVTEIRMNGDEVELYTSLKYGGGKYINTTAAVAAIADNPEKAVSIGYKTAYDNGIILTPPKAKKKYPKEMSGFGWCTWNAFYHDVTEDGIEAKLKELYEKGIRLKWLIIDDGWSVYKDLKLKSFKEDRVKFPSGFKAFISRIKKEYDVEYVGVWHAFSGYWFGIEKDSEVYNKQKENLWENNSGLIVPAGEYEKAYRFYNTWHSYLKEQGVDFLKVDAQGNGIEFYKNSPNALKKTFEAHKALEQSVKDNFGGVMINCMGESNIDMYSREFSAVARNSDDFFPDKEDGFEAHIRQNAYNAVFNDNLMYCDYDMWWTKHFSAKQSSILRAVSGGPVYVSDKVGETDKRYIEPMLDENGDIIRCCYAAKPTADCLFGYDKVLKVYNKAGENYAVALFNLSGEKAKVTLKPSDFYESGEFNIYMHFAKCDGRIDDNGIEIELDANDAEIINIGREKLCGDKTKYILK